MGLYVTAIISSSVMLMINRSENYKGAWIIKHCLLKHLPIFRGAVKAFLARFIIPVFVPGIIFTLIMGIKVIPDIVLIFINMISVLMLIFRMSKKELPLCRDFQYTHDGNTFGTVCLSFFIAGIFAGIHFLVSLVPPYGVLANIAVSALISISLWRSSFNISWKDAAY